MRAGVGKYKLRAGAVKYKFGAGAVKYKLGAGARPGAGKQIPYFIKYALVFLDDNMDEEYE